MMLDDGWGSPQSCSNIGKLEHATTYYNFITLKILETMLYNVSFAQTTGISKHGGALFTINLSGSLAGFGTTGFGTGLELVLGLGLKSTTGFFQLFSIFPYFHHWFFQLFSAA